VRLSLDPGPWCADAQGEADLSALAMLADLALGASIRAQLSRETRIATVSLALQFTGAPRRGRLHARGEFQGFFERAAGHLGLSRVSVAGSAGQICYGTGSFMALQPPRGMKLHPVPLRKRSSPVPRLPDEENLNQEERKILARADAALAAGGNFIERFWGGAGPLVNGLHAGNRVGHAQGGILVAMAAKNAAARLSGHWRLGAVSALYVSPGEGRTLRARSEVVHHGRLTAVVRTRVTGKNRRAVLEVVTTHSALAL
jgi:acyl-coenzyme A thioesterase PaaI-like protein